MGFAFGKNMVIKKWLAKLLHMRFFQKIWIAFVVEPGFQCALGVHSWIEYTHRIRSENLLEANFILSTQLYLVGLGINYPEAQRHHESYEVPRNENISICYPLPHRPLFSDQSWQQNVCISIKLLFNVPIIPIVSEFMPSDLQYSHDTGRDEPRVLNMSEPNSKVAKYDSYQEQLRNRPLSVFKTPSEFI